MVLVYEMRMHQKSAAQGFDFPYENGYSYIFGAMTHNPTRKYIVFFIRLSLKVYHVLANPKKFLIYKNWRKTL